MRLRLDSGFTGHRKVMGLGSRGRRWTWLEILVYTCDHGDPAIPENIGTKVPGASKAFLRDCEQLSLIDRASDGTLFVHDWRLYNGSIDERVSAYLEEHPNATANEVQSQIQGRRDVVLAAVKRLRKVVPGTSSGGTVKPAQAVPDVVPVALAKQQEQKQEQVPTRAVAVRKRDVAWDFVVADKGEPLPRQRAAYGRIASDLNALLTTSLNGASDDVRLAELHRRHGALANAWGDDKATCRSLVENWERAGRMADGLSRGPAKPLGQADRLMLDAQRLRQEELS